MEMVSVQFSCCLASPYPFSENASLLVTNIILIQVMVGTATITNLKQYLWMSPEEIARREAERQARRSGAPSVLDRSFMTNGSVVGVGTTGRGTPATLGSSSPTPSAVAPSQTGMSAAPTPAMSVRGVRHPPSVAGTIGTREPSIRGISIVAPGAPVIGTPAPSLVAATPSRAPGTPAPSVAGSLLLPPSNVHASPASSAASSTVPSRSNLHASSTISIAGSIQQPDSTMYRTPAPSIATSMYPSSVDDSTSHFTADPSVAGSVPVLDSVAQAHRQYTASAWEGNLLVLFL